MDMLHIVSKHPVMIQEILHPHHAAPEIIWQVGEPIPLFENSYSASTNHNPPFKKAYQLPRNPLHSFYGLQSGSQVIDTALG